MEPDRAQRIYDEIGGYEIKLERDPGALGPRYLNDVICQCRNYINAVSRIVLEIHREKHSLATSLSAEEAAYAVESADLLATDERVRRLPNIEDRKATVAVLLRDRARRINELRAEIQNLDYVDKAVRHRHKELKDTMTEIRTQRSLLRDEIDTKSFYGDETPNVRKGNGDPVLGSSMGIDEDELNRLMLESEGVVPAPGKPAPALTAPRPTGTSCPVCQEPQIEMPTGGVSCPNGHGFGSVDDRPEPPKAEPVKAAPEPAKGQGFYQPPTPPAAPKETVLEDLDLAAIDRFLDEPVPAPTPKGGVPSDDELESILSNI